MDTTDQILPPSESVLGVCDALEHTNWHFLREKARLSTGFYEAEVEALLIFNLGIRRRARTIHTWH